MCLRTWPKPASFQLTRAIVNHKGKYRRCCRHEWLNSQAARLAVRARRLLSVRDDYKWPCSLHSSLTNTGGYFKGTHGSIGRLSTACVGNKTFLYKPFAGFSEGFLNLISITKMKVLFQFIPARSAQLFGKISVQRKWKRRSPKFNTQTGRNFPPYKALTLIWHSAPLSWHKCAMVRQKCGALFRPNTALWPQHAQSNALLSPSGRSWHSRRSEIMVTLPNLD